MFSLPVYGLVLLLWAAVPGIPLAKLWRAAPDCAKSPQAVVRLRVAYLLFVTLSFVASALLVMTPVIPGRGVASVYVYYLVMVTPSWALYLFAINTRLDGLTLVAICGSPLMAMYVSAPVLVSAVELDGVAF